MKMARLATDLEFLLGIRSIRKDSMLIVEHEGKMFPVLWASEGIVDGMPRLRLMLDDGSQTHWMSRRDEGHCTAENLQSLYDEVYIREYGNIQGEFKVELSMGPGSSDIIWDEMDLSGKAGVLLIQGPRP